MSCTAWTRHLISISPSTHRPMLEESGNAAFNVCNTLKSMLRIKLLPPLKFTKSPQRRCLQVTEQRLLVLVLCSKRPGKSARISLNRIHSSYTRFGSLSRSKGLMRWDLEQLFQSCLQLQQRLSAAVTLSWLHVFNMHTRLDAELMLPYFASTPFASCRTWQRTRNEIPEGP